MGIYRGGRAAAARYLSVAMAAVIGSLPLVGCRGSERSAGPAGPYDTRPAAMPPQRRGMTTGQKVAILAGAAALYYLYNKHKNAQGEGASGRYYRSKNGRIYYRDAQGRATWVTPPAGGIQVPADEAR